MNEEQIISGCPKDGAISVRVDCGFGSYRWFVYITTLLLRNASWILILHCGTPERPQRHHRQLPNPQSTRTEMAPSFGQPDIICSSLGEEKTIKKSRVDMRYEIIKHRVNTTNISPFIRQRQVLSV